MLTLTWDDLAKRHKKCVEMDLNKRAMRKHGIHVTHTPYQPMPWMEVVCIYSTAVYAIQIQKARFQLSQLDNDTAARGCHWHGAAKWGRWHLVLGPRAVWVLFYNLIKYLIAAGRDISWCHDKTQCCSCDKIFIALQCLHSSLRSAGSHNGRVVLRPQGSHSNRGVIAAELTTLIFSPNMLLTSNL